MNPQADAAMPPGPGLVPRAGAAGGGTVIRRGFMPLLDAAIPIVAARKGFAAACGVTIDLVRESSWANIRDRLAIGHFDAAHLLAPMPVAAALGLTPLDVPLVAPIALGLGGNAVTVSVGLWAAMQAGAPEARPDDPVGMGRALRAVVEARANAGTERLVFGVVHPFSVHNYELRYWLAACGIRPDRDVEIAVLPPPFMPDALKSGRIDGFCVGEPWNSVAAQRDGGRIILTKSAIWRASPEKVLGLRADWAEADAARLDALVGAMIDAALWCGAPANHAELADLLSACDLLDVPRERLAPALAGRQPGGLGRGRTADTGSRACAPLPSARSAARSGTAFPTARSVRRRTRRRPPNLPRSSMTTVPAPRPAPDG